MPIVFLDKDGTLICDVPYNVDIKRIKFASHVITGLKKLAKSGFKFIVISNQPGVAMGLFKEKDVHRLARYLADYLYAQGIGLLDFYYCPHHFSGKVARYSKVCDCRKPLPGMIKHAAKKYDIDASRSWLIGDILDDVECGRRAGCRTVLIDNGNETQWCMNELRMPDMIVANFKEAADYITENQSYEKLASM